jgi:hypothetical protein
VLPFWGLSLPLKWCFFTLWHFRQLLRQVHARAAPAFFSLEVPGAWIWARDEKPGHAERDLTLVTAKTPD